MTTANEFESTVWDLLTTRPPKVDLVGPNIHKHDGCAQFEYLPARDGYRLNGLLWWNGLRVDGIAANLHVPAFHIEGDLYDCLRLALDTAIRKEVFGSAEFYLLPAGGRSRYDRKFMVVVQPTHQLEHVLSLGRMAVPAESIYPADTPEARAILAARKLVIARGEVAEASRRRQENTPSVAKLVEAYEAARAAVF